MKEDGDGIRKIDNQIQFRPVEGEAIESVSDMTVELDLPSGPYQIRSHMLTLVEFNRVEGFIVTEQIIRIREAYSEVKTDEGTARENSPIHAQEVCISEQKGAVFMNASSSLDMGLAKEMSVMDGWFARLYHEASQAKIDSWEVTGEDVNDFCLCFGFRATSQMTGTIQFKNIGPTVFEGTDCQEVACEIEIESLDAQGDVILRYALTGTMHIEARTGYVLSFRAEGDARSPHANGPTGRASFLRTATITGRKRSPASSCDSAASDEADPVLRLWRDKRRRKVATGQLGIGAVLALISLAGVLFLFRLSTTTTPAHIRAMIELWCLSIGGLVAGVVLFSCGLFTMKYGEDPNEPDFLDFE
jgi:hypothetical protein